MQGINRTTTGISSVNINHEAEESKGETKYNSKSYNEDDNNLEPTLGACFRQVSHHMNNDAVRLNPYWILIENKSTMHMFINRDLLKNIKDADKPINVYSSGGATHCSTAGILKTLGEVYLHKNGSANILSCAKVKDKHNITFNDVRGIFNVHSPYKRIHF